MAIKIGKRGNFINHKKIYFNIFILIFLIVLIILLWRPLSLFFENPDRLKNLIESYGIFSPLVFIVLQIIQIILAPIPGQITTVLGGWLFGTWGGIFYNLISIIFGSFLAFLIGRKFGRPVINYFVSSPIIKKFDKFTNSRQSLLVIFLIFLLPFFPDDAICFLAGLTSIPLYILVMVATLGRLPSIVIGVLFGNEIRYLNFQIILIYSIIFIIFISVYLIFRQKIERYLLRQIKK